MSTHERHFKPSMKRAAAGRDAADCAATKKHCDVTRQDVTRQDVTRQDPPAVHPEREPDPGPQPMLRVFHTLVTCSGTLCSSALLEVPLNLPSAFFAWCRETAAKDVAAQKVSTQDLDLVFRQALGDVLRRSIAMTACRVDGKLPRVFNVAGDTGPLPLHPPVVWHVDLRELTTTAPRTITMRIDRRSIPLSSRHGDAPMRLVAAVTFGTTTPAALWTRSFMVLSRQPRGRKAAQAPDANPALFSSLQGLFQMTTDDAGLQRIRQLLQRGACAAIRACSKHSSGVFHSTA